MSAMILGVMIAYEEEDKPNEYWRTNHVKYQLQSIAHETISVTFCLDWGERA